LSVAERRLDLLVSEDELARRRDGSPKLRPAPARGYAKLYHDHVLPADLGCDFDFLRASPLNWQAGHRAPARHASPADAVCL
jgi:dihydroxy-acid dehydratase